MKHLIDAVLNNPVAALQDKSPAADEIVAAGSRALPFVEEVLEGHWSSSAHAVDVIEAFSYLAQRIRAHEGVQ